MPAVFTDGYVPGTSRNVLLRSYSTLAFNEVAYVLSGNNSFTVGAQFKSKLRLMLALSPGAINCSLQPVQPPSEQLRHHTRCLSQRLSSGTQIPAH